MTPFDPGTATAKAAQGLPWVTAGAIQETPNSAQETDSAVNAAGLGES